MCEGGGGSWGAAWAGDGLGVGAMGGFKELLLASGYLMWG